MGSWGLDMLSWEWGLRYGLPQGKRSHVIQPESHSSAVPCLQSCVAPWAGPLLPQPCLGVVQKGVLNIFQNLVEELLAGLHAVQVHCNQKGHGQGAWGRHQEAGGRLTGTWAHCWVRRGLTCRARVQLTWTKMAPRAEARGTVRVTGGGTSRSP